MAATGNSPSREMWDGLLVSDYSLILEQPRIVLVRAGDPIRVTFVC